MKGRVCVVGNLNMDLILRGGGHLPDWGRGVECTGHLLTSSGQAGYLALGLGALGVETDVVGNVGNDAWGAQTEASASMGPYVATYGASSASGAGAVATFTALECAQPGADP